MWTREVRTWFRKCAPYSETQNEGGVKVRHHFEISTTMVSALAAADGVNKQ